MELYYSISDKSWGKMSEDRQAPGCTRQSQDAVSSEIVFSKDLSEIRYSTFVSVGNCKQSFIRLLKAVELQHDILPQPVLIQCGHTPFASTRCQVQNFISMDQFIQRVNDANLLILHAGAGSVLHAIRAGKRPIIMPRLAMHDEHVNDHQLAFASALHQEGKALLVKDPQELRQAIQKVLQEGVVRDFSHHTSHAIEIIQKRLVSLFHAI